MKKTFTRRIFAIVMSLCVVMMYSGLAFAAEGDPATGGAVYVSASGSDSNAGTEDAPFATLAQAVKVAESGSTIYVLSDLTMDKSARYYDKDLTITSKGGTWTVSRAETVATTSDNARSWYNPALIEVQTSGSAASLTITNLVIDDKHLKNAGTSFTAQVTNGSKDNTKFAQSAIIETTPEGVGPTTITLGEGAVLKNYGGMSALRATGGSTIVMKSGAVICDDQGSAKRAGGTAGVFLAGSSQRINFTMEQGAVIKDLIGKNAIQAGNTTATINGEIYGCEDEGSHVLQTAAECDITLGQASCIHDNISYYGVVYVNGSNDKLTVEGTIKDNYGKSYGAIVVSNNGGNAKKAILTETCKITGNISSGSGGGIAAMLGTVVIEGGEISGNIATTTGGGIYVRKGGVLIMNAGSVKNNFAGAMGGGIDFDGYDYSNNTARAEINGGEVSGNFGKCAISGAKLETSAAEGVSNDLQVNKTADHKDKVSGGTKDRNLFISQNATIGNKAVYFVHEDKTVEASVEAKINNVYGLNTMTQALKSLEDAAAAKGWGKVIASVYRQSGAGKFTFGDIEYDQSLPVYAVELNANADGTAADGVKVYKCKIEDQSGLNQATTDGEACPPVTVTLPASGENGTVLALVQPTEDNGVITIATTEDIYLDDKKDGKYDVDYVTNYIVSEGLFEEIKTAGSIQSASITIDLDSELAALEDITVDSEIFEVESTSAQGSQIVVTLKLKDGWQNAQSMETKISGKSTLDEGSFEDEKTLSSEAVAEVKVADKNRTVPSSEATTTMHDKRDVPPTDPDDPDDPDNPDKPVNPDKPAGPGTGDTSNMLPWTAMLLVSVLGAVGACVLRRREN